MDWELYLARMRPWAERLARKQTRAHPYLGKEDLIQEALIALWQTWEEQRIKRAGIPTEELCRIGTTAMWRRMLDVGKQAGRRGEPARLECIDGLPVRNGAGIDELLIQTGIVEVDAALEGLARRVLREVLAPGLITTEAVRRLWGGSSRRPWSRVRSMALAEGLGATLEEIQGAWRTVEAHVRCLLALGSSGCHRYSRHGAIKPEQPERKDAMMNESLTDLLPPGAEAPAAPKTAPKPSKKENKPVAKKSEKPKPAPKAAAPKAAAPKKVNPVLLPLGTKVLYTSDRIEGIRPNHVGEIVGVWYEVKWGEQKRFVSGRALKKTQ